jgi:hypothetical protein
MAVVTTVVANLFILISLSLIDSRALAALPALQEASCRAG